jgi:hypothetical protein
LLWTPTSRPQPNDVPHQQAAQRGRTPPRGPRTGRGVRRAPTTRHHRHNRQRLPGDQARRADPPRALLPSPPPSASTPCQHLSAAARLSAPPLIRRLRCTPKT